MLRREDLEAEVEMEKENVKEVDTSHTTVGTEGRTVWEAAGTEREETIAFDQSRDISSLSQAIPDNAVTAPCRSQHAKPGVEDTESESQCPVLERRVCPSSDSTCSPDTKSLNQRAIAGTLDNQTSLAAKHPGKVITTNVTINSLTVTFLEATVAEGFFKGH